METKSGFVNIGNARLYYETSGHGQPLVLIHAAVADSRQWDNVFDEFARDFSVLRYDLRGFGKSVPVEGEFSHMGDLVALLDQLDIQQPLVLIGSSMGGGMAMDFALAHPSRAKALVMVCSAPSELYLDVSINPKEEDYEKALEAGDLDLATELGAQIWFDGMGRSPHQVDQDMRKLAVEMNRLALSNSANQLGKRLPDSDTQAAARLGELKIPVLMIVGEYDEPYIHAAADYVVEKVPSARKAIIEDAGHLPNMDHPDQFHTIAGSFLDEVL